MSETKFKPSVRRAVVVGAFGGIGAATVSRLAAEGWDVVAMDLPQKAPVSFSFDPYHWLIFGSIPSETKNGCSIGSTSRPLPDQRFREGTRVFRVLSVAERDPGSRFLICQTEEEVAA